MTRPRPTPREKFEPCVNCVSGWVCYVTAVDGRAVKRCPCWKAWQAKLAQQAARQRDGGVNG